MCGKTALTSDEQDNNNENQQQEVIVETSYTFDTDDCAMMFKRFGSVYGNDFADE
ncbi:MAG: hypothetical protein M3247_07225 [Thermoproteota archaeon]|nr:hypothetical protein [Thermoproteota archaeon]